MAYNFLSFNIRLEVIADWLKKELTAVRTGKASPLLLDSVVVESFGSLQPIKHIATITVEDARTLRIVPWDRNHMKNIGTAIAAANLGVSTAPDSDSIRVVFPELTSERRLFLARIIKEKLEEAKISIRQEREKVLADIENKAKIKDISEDDKFKFKDDLQKKVAAAGDKLEQIARAKEEEISR